MKRGLAIGIASLVVFVVLGFLWIRWKQDEPRAPAGLDGSVWLAVMIESRSRLPR